MPRQAGIQVIKMSVELLDTSRFVGFRVRRQIAGQTFQEYFSLKKDGKRLRGAEFTQVRFCLLYTSPSPRDRTRSRMPSSA